MLEILAWVSGAVAVAGAAIIGFAARRPDTFKYARSLAIDAAPERIMAMIASPRAMNTWNPFAADPSSKGEYAGPESGPGAAYHFAGRSGTGRFEVVRVEPGLAAMRLVMTKPLACDNAVAFTLEPQGASTLVTWTMEGRQSLPAKIMSVFIDCDRMCGSQFEKGLADLKAKVEKAPLGAAA